MTKVNGFKIEYHLRNHGWADVTLSSEKNQFTGSVSYLHDSLSDIAEMALNLSTGANSASCLFMEEPGELHLIVEVDGTEAKCEGRWYDGWASWGITPEDDYKSVITGTCRLNDLIAQLFEILVKIHDDIGPEEYLKRWIEHEFPVEQYAKLKSMR